MLEMAAKVAAPEASRDFTSEGFFEYHLYSLDGRTTVKDNQTKQLALLAAHGVTVTKELAFYGARDYYRTSYGTPVTNQKVGVFLELRNRQTDGLGMPLPRGKVRVYKADRSGSQQLIGDANRLEAELSLMPKPMYVGLEQLMEDWRKLLDDAVGGFSQLNKQQTDKDSLDSRIETEHLKKIKGQLEHHLKQLEGMDVHRREETARLLAENMASVRRLLSQA